ncbi:hypothetical protein BDF21DRAFT_451230 [Thamnidium elegans]|nr:hypothetical protein BDF21DRAFT_451230 [Thamnidium elegans]
MLPVGQKKLNDGIDPEESDDSEAKPVKRNGRRKIKIEYIEDKNRRHITFSKRKAGIMKKAYELSTLTGTQVLLLVVSETGLVYTFTTTKLQPIVTKPEGKNLIQTCLNTPDPTMQDIPETKLEDQLSPQSTATTSPMLKPSPNLVRPANIAPPPNPLPTSAPANTYSQPPQMSMPPYNQQQHQQQQQQQQQQRYPVGFQGNLPQPSQPYPPQQQQYGQPPFYQGQNQPYPGNPQGYWPNNQPQNNTSPNSNTQQRQNVKQEQP